MKILRVLDHSIGQRLLGICGNGSEVSPLKTAETSDENLNLEVGTADATGLSLFLGNSCISVRKLHILVSFDAF